MFFNIITQKVESTPAPSKFALFSHLVPPNSVSDDKLPGLLYQGTGHREEEVLWLVGAYMRCGTREAVGLGRRVMSAKMTAFLRHSLLIHKRKRLGPLKVRGL